MVLKQAESPVNQLQVWLASGSFVARAGQGIQGVCAVFQIAVRGPDGGEALPGQQWTVVLEEVVMVERLNLMFLLVPM